jgi:hypothetical protein
LDPICKVAHHDKVGAEHRTLPTFQPTRRPTFKSLIRGHNSVPTASPTPLEDSAHCVPEMIQACGSKYDEDTCNLCIRKKFNAWKTTSAQFHVNGVFNVEKSCWNQHLKTFCHTLFAPTAKTTSNSKGVVGDDDTLNGDDDTVTKSPTPAPKHVVDDDASAKPKTPKVQAAPVKAASTHHGDDDDLWASKSGSSTRKVKKEKTVIMYYKGAPLQGFAGVGHKNPDGSDDDEGNGSNQIQTAYFAGKSQ